MIWVLFLLAGLIALLMIPVRVMVLWRTGSEPKIVFRWLFFQYQGYPQAPGKKKAPEKPPKRAPEKKAPAKEPEDFSQKLGMAVDLLASLKGAAGILIRRFKLYRVKLDMIVAKGDAARTAIAYGRVNGMVYGAYAAAKNFLRLGKPEISIRPCFTADQGDAVLELRGRLSPLAALGAGLYGGGAFLIRSARRGKENDLSKTQNLNKKRTQ